jgi:hypothetical protein
MVRQLTRYKTRYNSAADPLHFLVHGLTVTGSLWFRFGLGFRAKAGCASQFVQAGFHNEAGHLL